MINLSAGHVRVGGRPVDKAEAIRLAAGLLIEQGSIEPGYADSMLAREKVANTYLGNGIAIPHGISKDRVLEAGREDEAEADAEQQARAHGATARDPAAEFSRLDHAISMYFGCGLRAPHGGVFVLAIPNAVTNLGWYVATIVTGTIITAHGGVSL